MIESRKETTLVEQAIESPATDETSVPPAAPSTGAVPITRLVPGVDAAATDGRRERRGRRLAAAAEPLDFDAKRARRARRAAAPAEPRGAAPASPEGPDRDDPAPALAVHPTERETPRAGGGARRHRPRAPRAEKQAAADSAPPGDAAEAAGDPGLLPAVSAATAAALAGDELGKKSGRSHTLKRAQRKHHQAVAALGDARDNPTLGALNRHLNMLTQQLGTAHRVIGRVAAERDALRQQLADLQGIPVEEIVVTSIGASPAKDERPVRTRELEEPGEPPPQTGIARFNYFAHDDIDVMRKRRQRFALVLLGIALGIWLLGRTGFLQMPENLGKDSLTHLPLIGNLMSVFLAGWIVYRVVKIGGKGVKWVFPSDQKRRRR